MAPREEFNLIEDRIISGRGTIQLPTLLSYRHFRLWIDAFRNPFPNAVNKRYNPERSNYANLSFMAGDYVARTHVLQYRKEVIDIPIKESGAFLAPYLVCSQQAQGNFLAAIAVAVGLPPPVPGDPLYAEPIESPIDSLLFVCRDSTALQLRLYGLLDDIGCPGAFPNPKVNAPPPPSEPEVPPSTSVSVSPPYLPPDDEGNTIPFTGDSEDICADVGLLQLDYISNGVQVTNRYHPGKPGDTVSFTYLPRGGCSTPAQLNTNGQISFDAFGCNAVYEPGITSTYVGKIPLPPGGVLVPSELYPGCTGQP